MKYPFLIIVLLLSVFSQQSTAQDTNAVPEKYTAHNKGKFFFYWGGNREKYSKSDITFKGTDHNFTLQNVEAHDKPKGWHIDYVNPANMTIPQTNLRVGYFITDHYNISIGVDHMKYVMDQDKAVNYTGYHANAGSYGETLPNGQVLLTDDFLTFEHTDGLNYINSEFARVDDISKIFMIGNTDKFQINITEGIGAGFLYPKTNAKVTGKERHDDFHVSGFGISAKAGLNFTFFKYFFIQTELKGGYINLSDIRTTHNSKDRASQEFFFIQSVIAFGGIFRV